MIYILINSFKSIHGVFNLLMKLSVIVTSSCYLFLKSLNQSSNLIAVF